MKTDDLRQAYLEFFRQKGHRVCPSDVLVPTWDPSVLFTPAGMNQFKDHFLGKVQLEFTRAASCQKCLRTGDVDNVGRTPYHHTFFEMLGNFSFGDYFKREAILWAWEFLTDRKWLGLPADKLTATVYLDDDEAADVWHREVGLSLDRIDRRDEAENFWPASAPSEGPNGVCGPCSEIYYHPAPDREVEIWNLVFTQFNRVGDPPDNLRPLPSRNIDTGMGLERAAATLQGVESNYEIDILRPLVLAAAEACRVHYDPNSDHGRRLRRIADHVRACTFAIHENVYPGPNKEQYVVKRLLRRAVLDGRQLGVAEPFLHRLVPAVVDAMRGPYPELAETASRVAAGIEKEESNFFATIDAGLQRIEEMFAAMKKQNRTQIDGGAAAELYQTFGVPAELLEALGGEQGLGFDWPGYRKEMDRHSVESGKIADSVMGSFGPIDEIKSEVKATRFLGYMQTSADAVVRGIVAGEQRVERLSVRPPAENDVEALAAIILDQSPFYSESGGQVGDTGFLVGPRGRFEVRDTQRDSDLVLHWGRVCEGELMAGDRVACEVDSRRRDGIRRAHSATHILHYALRNHLGTHAQQRGSKVDDDWLRFDFTNLEAVSPEQLATIESETEKRVAEKSPISAEVLPLADARRRGAMMLFGEKYPDPVRMISMGEFSRELCGGTHLDNTGDVGPFEILSEEGVSAGTRRIVAVTGERARQHAAEVDATLKRATALLGCSISHLPQAVSDLLQQVKMLRKQRDGSGSGPIATKTPPREPVEVAPSYPQRRESLKSAARALNAAISDVVDRVQSLLGERESLQRQIADAPAAQAIESDQLLEQALRIGNARVVVRELPGANANTMRQLIDQIRRQSDHTAIFLASIAGAEKIQLVAGLSRDLVESGISAGDWVKQVAPVVGGGGGGKPDFAQAGGRQPENIKQALQAATDYMRAALAT